MTNSFGAYVHLPFCVHKCSYCDFYSVTQYGSNDMEKVVTRISAEIANAAEWMKVRNRHPGPVSTIFLGGGTPSLFPVPLLSRIFTALAEHFGIVQDAEVTIEANPETVSADWLEKLAGIERVTRVSLGAQSFQPQHLKALERLASADSVKQAAKLLPAYGFDNFSLDLIFAIPGQTDEQLIADIELAAALGPRHLSFYNLTLKPGHKLYTQLPDSDRAADLYELGLARLASLGFARYEISNFARENFFSRHNLLYWSGANFLGVGPSASSRFLWDGVFHHRKQVSDHHQYVQKLDFVDNEFVATTPYQTALEATFLELRKASGINLPEFSERYGYDPSRSKNFALFESEGLIFQQDRRLQLSARGLMLADQVTRDLVDENNFPTMSMTGA